VESWNGSVSVVGVDIVGGVVVVDSVDADADADVGVAGVVCAEVAVVVDDASADSPYAPVDGISAPCNHSQGC